MKNQQHGRKTVGDKHGQRLSGGSGGFNPRLIQLKFVSAPVHHDEIVVLGPFPGIDVAIGRKLLLSDGLVAMKVGKLGEICGDLSLREIRRTGGAHRLAGRQGCGQCQQ